jgi:GNAT superfamily N-acetyltransferase
MEDQSYFALGWAREGARLTDHYLKLVERIFKTNERQNLWRPTTLLSDNALLGVMLAADGRTALSGLHVVFDPGHTAHVQGMVTDPAVRRRGYAEQVLSGTLSVVRAESSAIHADLKLRLGDDGIPPVGPHRLYQKVGFHDVCDVPVTSCATEADAHLRKHEYISRGDILFTARLMRLWLHPASGVYAIPEVRQQG